MGAPPSSSDAEGDRSGGRADHSAPTDGASNTSPPPAVGLPPPFAAPRPAEPPEEYIDPISQEIMLDPVLLVETGQSYERASLAEWFQQCTHTGRPLTDPLTGQVLKSTTVVSNYSLKSLIATWAERQRISDLHSFAKEVGRQRSMAHGGPAAVAAQALGALRLSGGGGLSSGSSRPSDDGSWEAEGGRSSGAGYPAAVYGTAAAGGGGDGGRPQQAQQAQQAQHSAQPPAGPAQPHSSPVAPHLPSSLDPTLAQPGMYPTGEQQMGVGKQRQAELALAALRSAATNQEGASRGAAPYNAWTLLQLAGDEEGRALLWEGNAIPLAIFLLGQLQKEPGEEALAAAAPALCGVLQRLGARDAEAAASICQCGGVHALVCQLTAAQPELRAAACRALYFTGWQGADIRSAILEGLSQHAAACQLPSRPLLAFWRFWEQQQQQPSGGTATASSSSSSASPAAAGREAEREALTLLLHMIAEGCSRAARGSTDSAAVAAALEPLDAAATAVPAVVAQAAAGSEEAAVRFAAHEAAVLLCQLPQNRPLLISALLQQGQEAAGFGGTTGDTAGSTAGGTAGSMGAGNTAWLLWVLCFRADRGESRPSAVQAVAQQGPQLLALLEAALDGSQGVAAASRYFASGLLTCLLYEPSVRGDGSAAAAADAVRRLLASAPAANVLQALLAVLDPAVAAVVPQAARAAALAVANMAAFRGGAAAPAAPLAGGGGSGDVGKWLSSRIGGAMKHMQQQAAQQAQQECQQYAQPGQGQEEGQGQLHPAIPQQPTDPRGALLHHCAVPLLLSLVVSSSAAVAACTATAHAPPSNALTPDNRQAAAAAAAAAAEEAGLQRAVLGAALLALNNLCADPAAAGALRATTRASSSLHQQLQAALNAALGDRALPEVGRSYARLLLHTLSGAPGQRHQPACHVLPPPSPTPTYPNP